MEKRHEAVLIQNGDPQGAGLLKLGAGVLPHHKIIQRLGNRGGNIRAGAFGLPAVFIARAGKRTGKEHLLPGKGSASGVAAGNCVITETGMLVGVVSEVGTNWCTVSTIINTDIEMGGLVTRTYSAGVLEGDFSLMSQGKLKLNYLPEGAQLVSGDEVLTSGKGDVYPSGLVVGRVEGVFTDPSGMTRYAVITPDVDLSSLIEVFVIKDFDIVE